jgi:hypothetical protein
VVLLLGLATVLCVAHEYYDLLLLAWPLAAAVRQPVARLVDRLRLFDRPARFDGPETVRDGGRWGAVLALCALPALVVTVIPANDTVKVLGLGSGTSVISTLATACLLVAMAGALIGLAFDHPQEVAGADDSARHGPPLSPPLATTVFDPGDGVVPGAGAGAVAGTGAGTVG